MGEIDFGNLARVMEDARGAALEKDGGPADPSDFASLMAKLESARDRLPSLYRKAVCEPFMMVMRELGAAGLHDVISRDPTRQGIAALVFDVAQAILQNADERDAPSALSAFQEVLSDLYDGFLSAEDRRGVKAPDLQTLAPLAKWGAPEMGPYTFPVTATRQLGVGTAIVSLPPANARKGLVAWAALGHETAGHDILDADKGLRGELRSAVFGALKEQHLSSVLPRYWADRIDETAADVLGVLNMGPAAAIGLVVYFRALNAAYTGKPSLRCVGPAADPHPADIVRGYLAAAVVGDLKLTGASAWADALNAELQNDLRTAIVLGGKRIEVDEAKTAAAVAAKAVAQTPLEALEGHALADIQNWRDADEKKVQRLRTVITDGRDAPKSLAAGYYAAHAVAAGVTLSLRQGADTELVFRGTLQLLDAMHRRNPSWGPLAVAHRGDAAALRSVYQIEAEVEANQAIP